MIPIWKGGKTGEARTATIDPDFLPQANRSYISKKKQLKIKQKKQNRVFKIAPKAQPKAFIVAVFSTLRYTPMEPPGLFLTFPACFIENGHQCVYLHRFVAIPSWKIKKSSENVKIS